MKIMEAHSRLSSSQGQPLPASNSLRPAPRDRSSPTSNNLVSIFDAESPNRSFAEPPTKLRKTQAYIDKSKGIGTNVHHVQSFDPRSVSQPEDIITLPYPTHIPRIEPADNSTLRAPPRASLRNGVVRAGVPAPPAEAPRYSRGLNDYFPWERKHVEDVLTEPVTRAGYYEKASNNTTETGSARSSLISCIKSKSACDSLSNLLVACIERRQQLCSITAKNTFKPPPRVTLTDNKREAWLKDLADGAIPLRRLSRTIPHGIRGKSLLDHCLAKHVPSWRAVWLVKCVGSNEIRAFRRKGAGLQSFGGGGELKWLREWTDSVLAFIDSLAQISKPETADGRQHMAYALTLISHVYHEKLLDQGLFAQCLPRRLHETPPSNANACSLWLCVVKQYLVEVLKCCVRGCDLVKCLLSKLETAESASAPKIQPAVLVKCRKLLLSVLNEQPSSFILPESWHKWKHLVRSVIPSQDLALLQVYNEVGRRNMLLGSGVTPLSAAIPGFQTHAQPVLDQFDLSPDPERFMAALQRLASNSSDLMSIPIEWCISSRRSGLASIYLVARTIRLIAKKLACSFQDDLSNLLSQAELRNQVKIRRLCMLTAELVRSHHFSISKYLHFLLARGTSLLTESQLAVLSFIPRQALSTEVLNLAASMCSALNCASISDKDEVEFQVAAMQLAISKCRPTNGLTAEDQRHISGLNYGTKAAIALRLRKDVHTKRAEQSYPSPEENDNIDSDARSLQSRLPATLSAFELLQDYPTLADVLLLFLPTADLDSMLLLAACIKCHGSNFQAMSALEPLFASLVKRYAVLRHDGFHDRHLTTCMVDIARCVPNARQTMVLLENHLDVMNSDTGAMAPSPASDQLVDVIQSQEVLDMGELERLLQTRAPIPEDLFGKVLGHLIEILKRSQQDPEQMSNALRLLHRVEELDRDAFRSFLVKHLHPALLDRDSLPARKLLPWVVAGGLCPADELVASCLKMATDDNKQQVASQMAFNIVVSIATPPTVDLCNCVRQYYTFVMVQKDLYGEGKSKLSRLVELALRTASSSTAKFATTENTHDWRGLEQIVQKLLCDNPYQPTTEDCFEDTLVQLAGEGAPIEDMLCRIIKLPGNSFESPRSPSAYIMLLRKISDVAGPDTAVPCRLLAQIELARLEGSSVSAEQLIQAAKMFIEEDSAWIQMATWRAFLKNMSANFASTLHECALSEALSLLASLLTVLNTADSEMADKKWSRLQSLVEILEATQSKLLPSPLTRSFEMIARSLGGVAAEMDELGSVADSMLDMRSHEDRAATMNKIICLLLDISAIHTYPSHLTQISHDKLSTFSITMSKIFIDLQSHSLLPKTTSTTILDIILHVTSSLDDDHRSKCYSRVHGIYGNMPDSISSVLGYSERKTDTSNFFNIECTDTVAFSPASGMDTPRTGINAGIPRALNIDPWEMLQDTTPSAGANDTCLSMNLFGARKAVI